MLDAMLDLARTVAMLTGFVLAFMDDWRPAFVAMSFAVFFVGLADLRRCSRR